MTYYTYKDFLNEKDALSFEECQQLHEKIVTAIFKNDKEIQEYWSDFLSAAIDYASIRSAWWLLTRDERHATDEVRTTKHNKVIYTLKLVSRYQEQNGDTSQWFAALENNRKQIGDFANYLS